MSTHDIIDNRGGETLVDHLRRMLDSSEMARFAVGYFFLSGFQSVADRLANVKELRLLIGNTTNRQTLEQMAEGYRRLELVAEEVEKQTYRRRAEAKRAADETAANIRRSLEQMDQTDEAEAAVHALVRMIEEKRLKVRIYTKGRMHAKAYIFNYGPVYDLFGAVKEREEKGIAVVGSSNLTLAGVTHPTELNVVVHGNANHGELVRWFDALWDEAEDFDETLMREIQESWALTQVTPYELYLKTLYALVRDRLDGNEPEIIADTEIERKLTEFQRRAVDIVGRMIREHGGAFAADVVGLGKSFIGAAIVKRQERSGRRPLIICPAPLVPMWEDYNEEYALNAKVLSMGMLGDEQRAAELLDPENGQYRDRDFVLLDESHNFRNPDNHRYGALQRFLGGGERPCCFLTATPRNKSAWDVYHQIKLFHPDDKTQLAIDPPDLRQYFRGIDAGAKKLQGVLTHILYRRRRIDIIRHYGLDAQTHLRLTEAQLRDYKAGKRRAYVLVNGAHQFFPQRKLETVEYNIEEAYLGLYDRIRDFLGKDRRQQPLRADLNELTYARYGLWHYVRADKQKKEPYTSLQRAGVNLRGLVRVMMFKRLESSIYAFRETVRRMLLVHENFLKALSNGIVPAGEDAQELLSDEDWTEAELLSSLRSVAGRYNVADFELDRLRDHIAHDIELLKTILKLVAPITPEKDAKLKMLKDLLKRPVVREGKRLIFTQYADTAQYLYEQLNPDEKHKDFAVIYSSGGDKMAIVRRFAPKANPEQRRRRPNEPELNTVVATDVFSEGLNLQDCDKIINYDLHWNPVRLIQRFGRIDRIGSENDVIYGFNFLPETGIDRNLGLKQILRHRIQEIHDTIGEDARILDPSEQLNESAMYAIYEEGNLPEEEEDELVNLNDAEEILRQLKRDDPAMFERIARMPDGVRSAMPSNVGQTFVFCEAQRPGDAGKGYQQLFLIDKAGEVVTREIPRILGTLQCEPDQEAAQIPKGHNEVVMRIRRRFAEEVKHREAELQHTVSHTLGQRYVLRELKQLFGTTEDEDVKGQINLLERTFRGPLPATVHRELNVLRRNAARGTPFFEALKRIYQQNNLREWLDAKSDRPDGQPVARVICSEAFV